MAQQRHDITRASQRHNCTKRARPRSKTFGRNRNADVLLSNVHELAYWCQWRLAIRGACAEFDAAGEVEVEAWSRGRREEIGIAAQAKLCSEVRHLEAQLGRLASTNAKLDAALLEKGEELLKLQEDSISFSTEIVRLKVGKRVGNVPYCVYCVSGRCWILFWSNLNLSSLKPSTAG